MRPFEYVTPTSLQEACRLLHENESAKVMAGGVAMIILMRNRLLQPEMVVDIKKIPGLDRVEHVAGGLRIGSLVTHRALERMPLVRQHQPLLAETAGGVASVQVRNRGTLGGNICHAEPAADPPTVLMALAARVTVQGPAGARELAVDDFLAGYYETALAPDELLESVWVPDQRPHTGSYYLKFITRTAMDMCLLGVAAVVEVDPQAGTCKDVRIVLGNCDRRPVRLGQVEQRLRGERLTADLIEKAAQAADAGINPVSDMRGSAAYRKAMARISTARAVQRALARANGQGA